MSESETKLKELLDAALERERELQKVVFNQKHQIENLKYENDKLRRFLNGEVLK